MEERISKEELIKVIKPLIAEQLSEFIREYELKAKEISLIERIIRVEEELKAQREIIASLQREMNARFEAMDKRFEALQREMDKRFEALQREMDKRFEAVDKRFEAVEKRFEAMDKRFESLEKRLSFSGDNALHEAFQDVIRKFSLSSYSERILLVIEGKLTHTTLAEIQEIVDVFYRTHQEREIYLGVYLNPSLEGIKVSIVQELHREKLYE